MAYNMMIEVRYKDIDPKDGMVIVDKVICYCPDPEGAHQILKSLRRDWWSNEGPQDSNRIFYNKESDIEQDTI